MTIKTPEQIAESVRHGEGYALDEVVSLDGWGIQELLTAAIEADRAQIIADMIEDANPGHERGSDVNRYRILLASRSGRSTREWTGLALDDDAAIEQAEDANPGYEVHTYGPDVLS